MTAPLRIFIGWDDREAVAYHVLAHSIITRASIPVTILPLRRETLRYVHTRQRGPLDSTDFSITRFLTPSLCGFLGDGIYMDCDMLCLADIAELAAMPYRDGPPTPGGVARWSPPWSALVCKHEYSPRDAVKFLGEVQTVYSKKNWSSLIYFNAERCRQLTVPYVDSAPGLDLHQFLWTRPEYVGGLPLEWNWLHGEYDSNPDAKIIHYTLGGPWFKHDGSREHDLWCAERVLAGV